MGHYEILRMVRYYEVPLIIARRLAKYDDWEERARNWHLTEEGTDPPIRKSHLKYQRARAARATRAEAKATRAEAKATRAEARRAARAEAITARAEAKAARVMEKLLSFPNPSYNNDLPLQRNLQIMMFGEEE